MIKFRGMENSDKQFFVASVIAPVIVWWIFTGRKRYATGGMK